MQETQETWVQSLGWEDSLEWKFSIHSSILAWRIPWREEPGRLSPRGRKESDTTEWLSTQSRGRTSLLSKIYRKYISRTSPVVQWLRICLPMQGTQVLSLVLKILPAVEQLSPCATTTEPRCSRACAPQQKSHRSEKPMHHNEVTPSLSTTRESPCASARPSTVKNK